MIISVHIPKTAGMSLLRDLTAVFGERLLEDYGDWPELATAEGRAHNERRRNDMLSGVDQYAQQFDVVHGHFTARKYLNVFPDTALMTFVRDPYQHAVSTYEHAVRSPLIEHPGHHAFKEQKMTVCDFVEAFPNHQSLYTGGIAIDDFSMVGVSERYEQSMALFEAIFGITMPRVGARHNANPNKETPEYEISAELQQAVQRHRGDDIELYRRVTERFDALCAAYGV